MNSAESLPLFAAGHGAFLTTRWSLVLRAGDVRDGESGQALGQLCRDYWYPLYAYARRRGRSPEDAEDTTRGFFLHLLEGGMLQRADASRGRFRSFLLGAMQHHLANEHRSAGTQKRGSGVAPVSLDAMDAMDAEERFRAEPADLITPEAHCGTRSKCRPGGIHCASSLAGPRRMALPRRRPARPGTARADSPR